MLEGECGRQTWREMRRELETVERIVRVLAWLLGALLSYLALGSSTGRLKRSGNVGSSTRRGMVQAGPLLRAWLFRILLIGLS